MDLADRPRFDETVRRLLRTYRVRLKPDEERDLIATYFDLLAGASLEDVLTAGQACLETSRSFPKAADWFQALPPGAREAPDCRVMRADEAAAYVRAERQRYEDAPCDCLTCQAAAVTDRPLRFVPEFTADDRDERAFCPPKHKVVTTGHWAHGDELAHWYAARDRFFALAPPGVVRAFRSRDPRSFETRVDAIFHPLVEREPGEEG